MDSNSTHSQIKYPLVLLQIIFLIKRNFRFMIESKSELQLRYFHNQGQVRSIPFITLTRLRRRAVGRKKNVCDIHSFPSCTVVIYVYTLSLPLDHIFAESRGLIKYF